MAFLQRFVRLARCPSATQCGGLFKPIESNAFSNRTFVSLSNQRLAVVCFKLADLGEGIAEVELLKWHKNVGDEVEEMDEVCEVQSDKAVVEITSRYSGKILKLYNSVGDTIRVGGPLMDVDCPNYEEEPQEESKPAPSKAVEPESTPQPISSKRLAVSASPTVRRFAQEKGVDLSLLEGTGKGKIITKEDILAYLNKSKKVHTPTSSTGTEFEVKQLKGFKKGMVKSMNDSLHIPHMNIGDEYDVTRLSAMRQHINSHLKSQNMPSLSFTTFMLKAISMALKEFPILNSKFDNDTQSSYREYKSHNISIAMDTPDGLVVPNIKNVEKLSLQEIQSELSRLQELAKNNKLSPQELSGGTFSLSNVGVISGTYIHPLIFDGQAVIAGVGRLQQLPRFVLQSDGISAEENLEKRDIISCSYSADHRHCDGATVARFSKKVKTILENPEYMLISLR